ncbi:hypothetical protein FQN55_004321 [Onygenales sp. PD_40]|nr:hypothetical protein FQN55_004321 [Onygenales sp. PD_40]
MRRHRPPCHAIPSATIHAISLSTSTPPTPKLNSTQNRRDNSYIPRSNPLHPASNPNRRAKPPACPPIDKKKRPQKSERGTQKKATHATYPIFIQSSTKSSATQRGEINGSAKKYGGRGRARVEIAGRWEMGDGADGSWMKRRFDIANVLMADRVRQARSVRCAVSRLGKRADDCRMLR